jgi:hypothetical protein
MASQHPVRDVAPLLAVLVGLGVFLIARPHWVQNWVIGRLRRGWYFRRFGRLPLQGYHESGFYPLAVQVFGICVLLFAAAILALAVLGASGCLM